MMGNPTEVVITCKGRADDPHIQEKISSLLRKLSQAAGADERTCNLKSVEPWNSVKVSFDLPREAAVRLQELARSGDNALINLGILSVQIANGEPLDLNAIRDHLLQPPSPVVPPPPQVAEPPSAPTVSGAMTMPYQQVPQQHRQHLQQDLPPGSRSKPMQPAPMQPSMPGVGHQVRKQAPKRPPSLPPQGPQAPPRPSPSGSALLHPHPPASPATNLMGLHAQMMSPSGMKSPPFLTGPSPTSSIGNIPVGIPSLHLGQPAKSFNPNNPPMNLASPNSFSSVYSIAMSATGNPNAPIQTPMMQSLPNLPTPQSAPIGSFPWNLGAKQPQFGPGGPQPQTLAKQPQFAPGIPQPQTLPQWNQPMFPGGPSLPTNLPGSIPSVGPLPSPSRVPPQRPVAPPPAKPKKKKKRPRKPPKDKIPRIPLPPPLMLPPDPKPPPASSEGIPPPKPLGMPVQPNLNPISPNVVPAGMTNQNPPLTSLPQQHPHFPFTQAQVSQAGGSDVSMTSPLLVNLLQSDIASTRFPVQPGEPLRAASLGSSQRMMAPSSHPPGTTMPTHAVSDASGLPFPRNQQLQAYPHLLHRQQQLQQQLQQQQLQQQQLQQQQAAQQQQQAVQQQQHGLPMPQLSLPNQSTFRPDSGRRSIESFQQQQQQPFPTPMAYPPGAPSTPPINFNRFPLPQGSFPQGSFPQGSLPQGSLPQGSLPPDHLQFMMQQVSQAALAEHRMPTMPPQLRGNLPLSSLPQMTTAPPMASHNPGSVPTPVPTSPVQNEPSPPEEPAKRKDPKSSSFDEESAMAGMTEAERDTFAAAARIAQDSKPGGMELDEFGEIDASGEQPLSKKDNEGRIPMPPQLGEGFPPPNRSAHGMYAIENLAMSHQQLRQKARKHDPPLNMNQAVGLSRLPAPWHPHGRQGTSGVGDESPEMLFQQALSKSQTPSQEKSSGDSIDLNSLRSSCSPAAMTQKIPQPPLPFPPKAVSQPGPTSALQNPFLTMPSIPPSVGPGENLPTSHFTGAPSGSVSQQGWAGGSNVPGKVDPSQPDGMGKLRGSSADGHGTTAVPSKTLSSNPFEWPFSNISPPTQNLSSEGLQFMAKLAGDSQFKDQPQMAHYPPLPEGSRSGKQDKPHLKALLNEISPTVEGGLRTTKRSSTDEKGERKRRKSSPRPAAPLPDQIPSLYQPQRRIEHPGGGSIELPRVPTAEELSFSVQQARAHSLDLLKGASSGYLPPMPKSAPSSPRGSSKSRTKSVESTPQYGLQQSDLYRSKHGTLTPANPMSGGLKVSTGGSKSGKSKESKSRSKSPKASGSKSSKVDALGLQSPSTPSTTNVPFAGVHEFRPPPGLNIRGPTNPLPYQHKKTPPQGAEVKSPLSPPQGIPQFGGAKQYQQQRQSPLPPPTNETQKKSPRGSRPSSPFPSASALLSSFAQSAGVKVPDLPATTASAGAESPIQSPGYVTSPPLQKISTPTLPTDVNLEVPGEGFPDDFHPVLTKGRAEQIPVSFPPPPAVEVKKVERRFQPTEQGQIGNRVPPYPGTTMAQMGAQMAMGRVLSPTTGIPGGQSIIHGGHFQAMPTTYPSTSLPGVPPPLWRPQTSKQHLVSSDPKAHAPFNVNMPPSSQFGTFNLPTLRRPIVSQSASPQFGLGQDIEMKQLTRQHPGLSLRDSEANLPAYQTSSVSGRPQKSAIGVGGHDTTIMVSGTPPPLWPYGETSRPTSSPGMSSIVQQGITTSTVGQHPGEAMTRVTRVIPIPPQTGSSIPSYPGAMTGGSVPRHGSPGLGRSPGSLAQSHNRPAPFSVSSLVSSPSVILGSQHSREHRALGIAASQQMMSAGGDFSSGSLKLEQTSIGSNPPLFGAGPISSAPVVTMENLSGVSGSVSGGLQPGRTAAGEVSVSSQESGAGERVNDDPPLGPFEKVSRVVAGVTATATSSPHTSHSLSTSSAAGNYGRQDSGEVTSSGEPGDDTASSDMMMEGYGMKTSSGPSPIVGIGQPVGMDAERPGERMQRPGAGGSVGADIAQSTVHGMPEPGDTQAERATPRPGEMASSMDPLVSTEVAGDECGTPTGSASPLGDDQDDGEDEESATSRKRSMRASGREKYYGPVPTYKRRKSNQK